MKPTFTIPGRLPSLNDVISACRSNYHIGAKLKKETDETICECIREQCVPHFTGQVSVGFGWYEKDARRDLDNVESAKKFILDALQKEHVIMGDSQKWIPGPEPFRNHHEIDKENPRIEVFIRKAGDAWNK